MSKIVNDLNDASDNRGNKFTKALSENDETVISLAQKMADEPVAFSEEESAPVVTPREEQVRETITVDKQALLMGLCCVVFMGVVSLVLSFKAFSQIQKGNENVIKLGQIIISQNDRFEGMNNALIEARKDGRQVVGLNASFADIEKGLKSRDEIIERLTENIVALRGELNDMKTTNQGLRSKIIDVSTQVRSLRMRRASNQ